MAAPALSDPRSSRLASVVTGAAATSALVVLALVASSGGLTGAPESTYPEVVVLLHAGAVALLLVATWVSVLRMPGPIAVGLSLISLAVTLPVLAGSPALPLGVRAALIGAWGLASAGAAITIDALTHARSDRRGLWTAAAFCVSSIGAHALLVNPGDEPGCFRLCRSVEPAVASLGSRTGLGLATILLTAPLAMATLWGSRSGLSLRRAPRAVLLTALLLLAVPWGVRWASWPRGTLSEAGQHAGTFGAGLFGLVVLTKLWSDLRVARRVERMARDLEGSAAAAGVEFVRPGSTTWITPEGLTPSSRREEDYRVFDEHGDPVARWPVGAPFGSARLSPATRMQLGNARVAAARRAELRDLRESQARVVAATESERTRIERNLHDGVQQRLVGALIALGLAEQRSTDDRLAAATRHVRGALSGLRQVAAGLSSPILDSDGLWAALEDLAEKDPRVVGLKVVGPPPASAKVSRTAYRTAVDLLRLTDPSEVRLAGRTTTDGLQLRFSSAGLVSCAHSAAFTDVRDLVGGSSGTLTIDTARNVVEVFLPCAS